MSYEVTGRLIEKGETQRVSDRFQKREFVIEFTEMINGQPSQYPNFIKLTLVQQKVDIIDRFDVGTDIKVNFNLRGSRYEKEGKVSYFTNLDAWRIENAPQEGNNGNNSNNNNQQQQSNNGNNNGGGSWSNNNNGNNGGNWSGGSNNNNSNSNAATSFSGAPAAEGADDLPF